MRMTIEIGSCLSVAALPVWTMKGMPAEPAAELLTIHERHGSVRRDGRWTLPHRDCMSSDQVLEHLRLLGHCL